MARESRGIPMPITHWWIRAGRIGHRLHNDHQLSGRGETVLRWRADFAERPASTERDRRPKSSGHLDVCPPIYVHEYRSFAIRRFSNESVRTRRMYASFCTKFNAKERGEDEEATEILWILLFKGPHVFSHRSPQAGPGTFESSLAESRLGPSI